MNDVVKVEQVANPLEINKDRLREWQACASLYAWYDSVVNDSLTTVNDAYIEIVSIDTEEME